MNRPRPQAPPRLASSLALVLLLFLGCATASRSLVEQAEGQSSAAGEQEEREQARTLLQVVAGRRWGRGGLLSCHGMHVQLWVWYGCGAVEWRLPQLA